MSKIDYQALREEFQYMQEHYSDPADREKQELYIYAETLLYELDKSQQYIKRRDQENEDIALTVGRLRVELEAEKQRAKVLFMENARLKSGIAGLIHLGIRYADVEVMKIAGDAQLSTPCTDSIINSIATGIRIKGE
ncbi:TPA: ead/Ea22-like family protein [Escherichia coli]|nr:ead/Ea22-like family protein [Escherichia coli]HBA1210304.1 ead/Ea22-like family protein [Escherichia coli]HDQ3579768.1 ead/Ea22-like family protein [Escherichia coli]